MTSTKVKSNTNKRLHDSDHEDDEEVEEDADGDDNEEWVGPMPDIAEAENANLTKTSHTSQNLNIPKKRRSKTFFSFNF